MIAFVDDSAGNVECVAKEMAEAAALCGTDGDVIVTKPAPQGASLALPKSLHRRTMSNADLRRVVTYRSTRDCERRDWSFREVVMTGLAPDGGLFVPNRVRLTFHGCHVRAVPWMCFLRERYAAQSVIAMSLLLCVQIPKISAETLSTWINLPFTSLAVEVIRLFVQETELPTSTLRHLVNKSFATFSDAEVAPSVQVSGRSGSVYGAVVLPSASRAAHGV